MPPFCKGFKKDLHLNILSKKQVYFCLWKERLTEPVLKFFWAQEQERNGFDLPNPLTERERNGFENLSISKNGNGNDFQNFGTAHHY